MRHTMRDVLSTPVLDLLRGRVAPMQFGESDPSSRPNAITLVAQSSLPDSAKGLIKRVIRKTRLWRSEKRAVAEELVAHFVDGLEAGRPADDLVTSFGNPAKAAKLIRRAKRRNRPLWWQIWYRSGQAIACFIAVYIGAALLLLLSHPAPSINYIARLNAKAAAAPVAESAWPVYRGILAELNQIASDRLDEVLRPKTGDRVVRPGDPTWPEAMKLVSQHQGMLARVREASAKPYLGFQAQPLISLSKEDYALHGSTPQTPRTQPLSRVDQLAGESVVSVLLPHLAKMRALSAMLCVDANEAAARGDGQRVLEDYRAVLGMARQCREHNLVITQLVAVGLCIQADTELGWIAANHPDTLRDQRVTLLHEMAAAMPLYQPDISGEKAFAGDAIQRVYSGTDTTDGHVTLDGLRLLRRYSQYPPADSSADVLLTPAAALLMASRQETQRMFSHYYGLAEDYAKEPLWVRIRQDRNSPADKYALAIKESPALSARYQLFSVFAPRLSIFCNTMDAGRAVHAALMTAISLDVYRQRTGKYPDALDELVPQYLPEVPLDVSTGQPLCYKLKDGKPLLYGRGMDGNDDGGISLHKSGEIIPVKGDWVLYIIPAKGDWVLYPRAEPQQEQE